MFDIKPLENEWKIYKKKQRYPWYKRSIIFILFVILLFNYKINFSLIQNFLYTFIEDNAIQKLKDNNESVFLINPSLFILQIKKNTFVTPKESINISRNFISIPLLDNKNNKVNLVNSLEKKQSKKLHIEMTESGNIYLYKDIEKRFLETHDVDDALFLAKHYYENHKYKKSEYWALQTNKIDERIEESLFIFVKSKIKLGKKNEGIAILMSYLKNTNSAKAKKILYKIKKNKL